MFYLFCHCATTASISNQPHLHCQFYFQTDWNDGRVLCEIVKGLGGSAPAPDTLNTHHSYWESNIKKAVDAGHRLGVKELLSPKDMANPDVEHLGIMAYAAHLQWVTPRAPLSDSLVVHLESTSGRVNESVRFDLCSNLSKTY